MSLKSHVLASLALLVLVPLHASAAPVLLDFEGLSDSTPVGTLSSATFTNGTALVSGAAGGTLNELEFPPRSGVTVLIDDAGPMRISFSTPVLSFNGFVTYTTPLTLQAFDAFGGSLGIVSSRFDNNAGLSGEPGSTPNEFMSITAAAIASITVTGSPDGGSFTLDDASFESAVQTTSVPEPTTILLIGVGCAMTMLRRSTR